MPMTVMQVQSRALTDDLLIVVTGKHALTRFQAAFTATFQHLQAMYDKVAALKSKTFANTESMRTWLRSKKYHHINQTESVVTRLRDLGSHKNISHSKHTYHSKQIFVGAELVVHKIGRLPHSLHQKAPFIRSAGHSRALYATEWSAADELALAHYSQQIIKILSPKTYNHSVVMIYSFANIGQDLDPSICMFARKIKKNDSTYHG